MGKLWDMAKCNPKNHVLANPNHCEHEPVKHRPGLAGTPTGCRIDKCTCCDCREWRRLQRRKERGADETAAPAPAPAPARPARAAKTAGEPRTRARKPTAAPTAPAVADPRKLARADLAEILAALEADPGWWSTMREDAPGEFKALAALIESHNAKGKNPRLRFENDDEVGWFVAPDTEPEPEPDPAPEQPAGESYMSALARAFKLPVIGPGPLAGAVPRTPARTQPESTIPAQPRPRKPVRYDGPAKPRNVPMGNAPSLPGSGVARTSDTRLVRYEITPNSHWMCEVKLSSDIAHCSRAVGSEHEWQYRVDGRPVCQDHYNAVRVSHPKRCEYRRNHLWVRAG